MAHCNMKRRCLVVQHPSVPSLGRLASACLFSFVVISSLFVGPSDCVTATAAATTFLDPRSCAVSRPGGQRNRRWAFVIAHDLHVPPNATELREALRLLRHFHPSEDVVFLHPPHPPSLKLWPHHPPGAAAIAAEGEGSDGILRSGFPSEELMQLFRRHNVVAKAKAIPQAR